MKTRKVRRFEGVSSAEPLESRVLLAVFAVTTTDDSGPGSLRQALLDANAAPGTDVVTFSGVPHGSVIRPLSPLPTITDWIMLNGNGAEIDGSAAGPTADGLVFAIGSVINSLAIHSFGGSGVVTSAPELVLQGTSVGTDRTGTARKGNGWGTPDGAGVKVLPGGGVAVGREELTPNPVGASVMFNHHDGVQIAGGSATFYAATVSGNGGWGVSVRGDGRAGSIQVAGPDPFFRLRPSSIFSENGGGGVFVGPGATARVQAAGIRNNSGGRGGLRVQDGRAEVWASSISGNAGGGVTLEGPGATGSFFAGNSINDNAAWGLALRGGAHDNLFGFLRPNPREPVPGNSISSNGTPGDSRGRAVGVLLTGEGTTHNVFVGNSINDNTDDGVRIEGGASGNVFAGLGLEAASISGNAFDGVEVRGASRYNAFYNVTIARNGGMPIDLVTPPDGPVGPNPDDPLDADAGANDLLNRPVITSAVRGPNAVTTVTGTIDTTPNTAGTIHVYADTPPASGSFGPGGPQAGRRVAEVTVTTDAAGHADFTATTTADIANGSFVTAAALVPEPGAQPLYAVLTPAGTPADMSEFATAVPVDTQPARTQVESVFVQGRWSFEFGQYLQQHGLGTSTHGYRLTPQDIDSGRPLPWGDVFRVYIFFTGPVSTVSPDDLRVTDSAGPLTVVQARGGGRQTEWQFDRPLARGSVQFTLDGSAGGVTHALDGSPMDGEWRGSFPSGDGTVGGDFSVRLAVLPGDGDRNGRLNALDLAAARQRLNTSATDAPGRPAAYSPFYDVDGSGRIDALDLAAIRRSMFAQPPA